MMEILKDCVVRKKITPKAINICFSRAERSKAFLENEGGHRFHYSINHDGGIYQTVFPTRRIKENGIYSDDIFICIRCNPARGLSNAFNSLYKLLAYLWVTLDIKPQKTFYIKDRFFYDTLLYNRTTEYDSIYAHLKSIPEIFDHSVKVLYTYAISNGISLLTDEDSWISLDKLKFFNKTKSKIKDSLLSKQESFWPGISYNDIYEL